MNQFVTKKKRIKLKSDPTNVAHALKLMVERDLSLPCGNPQHKAL